MRSTSPIMFKEIEDNVNHLSNDESYRYNFTKNYNLNYKNCKNIIDVFLTNFKCLLEANNITNNLNELNMFYDKHRRIHYFLTRCINTYTYSLSFNEVISIIDMKMLNSNNYLPLYNIKNIKGGIEEIKKKSYEIVEEILLKEVGL